MAGVLFPIMVVFTMATWCIIVCMLESDRQNKKFAVVVSLIQLFIITIFAYTILTYNKIECTPKAIDVYRNKTTLEITYKDNVPIDSVVVFK